jgi:hypothetical protein
MATQSKLEKQAATVNNGSTYNHGWDKASWVAGYVRCLKEDFFGDDGNESQTKEVCGGSV